MLSSGSPFAECVQDGPVHDAQWSPDGSHFIVVAGFMPAKAVLYSAKCKPVFDLGSGSYNLIKWNPQASVELMHMTCMAHAPGCGMHCS